MTDSRRIENGDHALTVVHQRWDTCAGKAFRAQPVAKRSQGGNVGRGKAFAGERDDGHWAARFPGSNDSRCAALTDQGNEAVNRSPSRLNLFVEQPKAVLAVQRAA